MFIDDKNQAVLTDNKCSVSNKLEIAANLHNQIGLPLLPQTTHSRFLKIYITAIRFLGIWGSWCVILISILWIIYAILLSHIGPGIGLSGLSILIAGFTLTHMGTEFFQKSIIELKYPMIVANTLNKMVTQKNMGRGQILSVKSDDGFKTIQYEFSILENIEKARGQFTTRVNKHFSVGDELVILYLDEKIHTLL